jgi:hypothetical protein
MKTIGASMGAVITAAVLCSGCSSGDDALRDDSTTAAGGGASAGGTGGFAGQGGAGGESLGTGGGTTEPGAVTDFTLAGPLGVSTSDGTVPMAGCGTTDEMAYTLYSPTGEPDALLVVLGHGFNRRRQNMAEMAERMASYGVRVVTFDYCHLSITDTDHPQNGADQVALAATLAEGAPVIHAGYSAGGLAALLATANATGVALLLLDAVDSDGLGASAAAGIAVPVFGVEGEPSSCNNQSNGGTSPAKLAPGGWATLAIGATHCDFEGPTDWLCTGLCGGQGAGGQRDLIRTLATAFVAWQSGADATGQDWVTTAGASYQSLQTSGLVASR